MEVKNSCEFFACLKKQLSKKQHEKTSKRNTAIQMDFHACDREKESTSAAIVVKGGQLLLTANKTIKGFSLF